MNFNKEFEYRQHYSNQPYNNENSEVFSIDSLDFLSQQLYNNLQGYDPIFCGIKDDYAKNSQKIINLDEIDQKKIEEGIKEKAYL